MSCYHIVIAKAENERKLTKPYILFDMCWNDTKSPKKLTKIMQDTKIIMNDIDDFLKEPGEFVQKDYDEYQMMKTIYFTTDSRDLERNKPSFGRCFDVPWRTPFVSKKYFPPVNRFSRFRKTSKNLACF